MEVTRHESVVPARPGIRPRTDWNPGHIARPRLYVYVDMWQGGSLVEVGFEFADLSFSDPALRLAVEAEGLPGSLLDRLASLLYKVERFR